VGYNFENTDLSEKDTSGGGVGGGYNLIHE
jgi:hypothetical protein